MSTKNLSRWSGIACILAGFLIVLATLVHPSRETLEIILEQELRLVAAHWLTTFSCGFLLLGLPGLYAAQSERAGRLGLVSFLMLFFGTLFSGGLAQIAIHSVETLAAYTLAWHVAQEGNLAVVQALFDLQNLAVYYWAIPVAAMLTATSIITVRTLVFPRWLGWVGFVIAMGWLVVAAGVVNPQQGPLTAIGGGIALIGFELVWMPATSFFLMRRAGAGGEAAPGGALTQH